MPKALENKLKREARKRGLSGRSANAYVYGTLRKTGWTPSPQKMRKKAKKRKKPTRKRKGK